MISDACFDYPNISMEKALKAILKRLWLFSFLPFRSNRCHVVESRLRFNYRIDVDTYYEKRTVHWDDYDLQKHFRNRKELQHLVWNTPFRKPELYEDHQEERTVRCNGYSSAPLMVRDAYETITTTHMVNTCNLPKDCVSKSRGILVFKTSGSQVVLDSPFLDPRLNKEAHELLSSIQDWVENSQVLVHNQDMYVSVIPVRDIVLRYGGRIHQFSVYDKDMKILCIQ